MINKGIGGDFLNKTLLFAKYFWKEFKGTYNGIVFPVISLIIFNMLINRRCRTISRPPLNILFKLSYLKLTMFDFFNYCKKHVVLQRCTHSTSCWKQTARYIALMELRRILPQKNSEYDFV